jgi:hypothetical protein
MQMDEDDFPDLGFDHDHRPVIVERCALILHQRLRRDWRLWPSGESEFAEEPRLVPLM